MTEATDTGPSSERGTSALERAVAALNRHPVWIAVAVVGVALTLRLLFVWETATARGFALFQPGLDVDLYWRGADHILEGRERSFALETLSAPLFAYIVAGWKALFGDSLLGFRVFLAVQSSLRFGLLYSACRRWDVPAVAAGAACLLLAVLPSTLYFDTVPLKVSLELTMLTVLFFALSGKTAESTRAALRRGAIIGGLLVALFLSQLNTLLLVGPVFAFVLLGRGVRRYRWITAGTLVALFMIVFVGFLARNTYTESRHFSGKGGFELTIGFHESSWVTYRRFKAVPAYPEGHVFVGRLWLEGRLGKPITRSRAEELFQGQALSYILENPGRAIGLMAQRALHFFNNRELPGVKNIEWVRQHSFLARSRVGFGWVVTVAAIGVVVLWRRRRRIEILLLSGAVAAVVATVCATWLNWRFRLTALVPLTLLAAFGFAGLGRAIGQLLDGRWAQLKGEWPLAIAAVAGALFAFVPSLDDDHTERHRRVAAANDRQLELAEKSFRELGAHYLAADTDIPSRIKRASLLARLRRHSEAFELLGSVEEALPDQPAAATDYLKYLAWRGEYEAADEFVQRLLQRSRATARRVVGVQHQYVRRALGAILGEELNALGAEYEQWVEERRRSQK